MTVVTIVGILAAIALPSISTMMGRRTAATEVEKVKAAIEEARDDARAQLRCMRVTKLSASSLQIEEISAAALTGCTSTVVATTVRLFRSDAVDITSNINVTFDRGGALTGTTAAFVDVIVSEKRPGAANEPCTLRIFRLLGLVRRVA
jgi:type II secretory pathway pseudopilin PulG